MISHNLQHKSLNQIWASCLHIDIWSCKYYFHICSKCICHFHSLYTHSITLECQIVHVIPQEFTLDLTKNYLTYIPCFLVHESQNFQVVSYRLVLLVHHKKRQLSPQFGVLSRYEKKATFTSIWSSTELWTATKGTSTLVDTIRKTSTLFLLR